jgi:nicotinamide riboside kinase
VITISGPPFSGKTTLWHALRERLAGRFEFVPDLPRLALEALDPDLRAWSTPEFQHYVGFTQLLREHAEPKGCEGVYDKSLIDALAYWRALFGSGTPPWSAAMGPGRYRLAFVCDYTDIDLVARGLHTVHLAERESIEREVLRAASESADRTVRLSGSPSARIELAMAELDRLPV